MKSEHGVHGQSSASCRPRATASALGSSATAAASHLRANPSTHQTEDFPRLCAARGEARHSADPTRASQEKPCTYVGSVVRKT